MLGRNHMTLLSLLRAVGGNTFLDLVAGLV